MNNHNNARLQDSLSSVSKSTTSPMDRFKKLEERILASGTDEEKATIEKARIKIDRMNKNYASNEQFRSFMLDSHFTNMLNILGIQCSSDEIIVNGSVFKTLDNLFNMIIKAIPVALFKIEQTFDENSISSFFVVMQKYCEYEMLTSAQKITLKIAILEGCKKVRIAHKNKWTREIAVLFCAVLSALRTGSRFDTEVDLDENRNKLSE